MSKSPSPKCVPTPKQSPEPPKKKPEHSLPEDSGVPAVKEIDIGALHTMPASGQVSCSADQWLSLMEYVQ